MSGKIVLHPRLGRERDVAAGTRRARLARLQLSAECARMVSSEMKAPRQGLGNQLESPLLAARHYCLTVV